MGEFFFHAGKTTKTTTCPPPSKDGAGGPCSSNESGDPRSTPDHTRTWLHDSDGSPPKPIPSTNLPNEKEVRAVLEHQLHSPSPIVVTKLPELELNKEQTEEFLGTRVKTCQIVIKQSLPAGIVIARGRGVSMSRRGVLKRAVIWYAECVLGIKLTGKAIDDKTVQALDAMENLTKEEAREKYLAYVFKDTEEKDRDGGCYASDTEGDDMMAGLLYEVFRPETGATDLLELLPNKFTGLSRQSPWLYSGVTFAGHHIEDAFMHFFHLFVLLKFALASLGDIDRRLLECMERLSFRDWLFCSKSSTPEDVQWLCREIETAFKLKQGWYEKVLDERNYVLSPVWWQTKHPGLFKLVHQGPGDSIVTNQSHNVVGFGVLSFAHNIARLESVRHYVACECLAAVDASKAYMWYRIVNQNVSRGEGLTGCRGHRINFCLTSELMRFLMEEIMPSPEVESALCACADMAYKCNETLAQFRAAVDRTRALTPHEQHMTCAGKRTLKDAAMVCGICGLPLPFYAVHSVLYFEAEYNAFICGVCAERYTWADGDDADQGWMPIGGSEYYLHRLGIGPCRNTPIWTELRRGLS